MDLLDEFGDGLENAGVEVGGPEIFEVTLRA